MNFRSCVPCLLVVVLLGCQPSSGADLKLNIPIQNGGNVYRFWISPDSRHVVYLAMDGGPMELYSAALDGGGVTKLNGPLVAGGGVAATHDGSWYFPLYEKVLGVEICANSDYVVYLADQEIEYQYELYSVPITGGAVTRLNITLPDFFDVANDFQISPDGTRVVYRLKSTASIYADGHPLIGSLHSVPIQGGDSTMLNAPLVTHGIVSQFEISPDSSRVVYRADQDTDTVIELYSVPLTGGVPTKLNKTPLAVGDPDDAQIEPLVGQDVTDFRISPDSAYVVYNADQDNLDSMHELYSSPIAGGEQVKLNAPLGLSGDVHWGWWGFRMGSDSARVFYCSDYVIPVPGQASIVKEEFFSVPIGGGEVVQLDGPGDTDRYSLQISPNGQRAVFVEDGKLCSVPATGGELLELGVPLGEGAEVSRYFRIASDSTHVVCVVVGQGCYSVPIAGGQATLLLAETVHFKMAHDRPHAVLHGAGWVQHARLAGGALSGPLNSDATPVSPGDRQLLYYKKCDITPDDRYVVYLGTDSPATSLELFATALNLPQGSINGGVLVVVSMLMGF